MSSEAASEKVEESQVKKFLEFLEKVEKQQPPNSLFWNIYNQVRDHLVVKTFFANNIVDHILAYKILNHAIAFYLDNHLVIEFGAYMGKAKYLYCHIHSLLEPEEEW